MSKFNTYSVIQTDTVALSYSVGEGTQFDPYQVLTNWTCRVMVKTTKSASALIDMTITTKNADNTAFVGLLQTTSLSPGEYFLMAKLYNTVTTESKEIHQKLVVGERGVF